MRVKSSAEESIGHAIKDRGWWRILSPPVVPKQNTEAWSSVVKRKGHLVAVTESEGLRKPAAKPEKSKTEGAATQQIANSEIGGGTSLS